MTNTALEAIASSSGKNYNRELKTNLELVKRQSWVTQTFHQSIDIRLKVVVEICIWKTIAIKDMFESSLGVGEDLMQLVTMVNRIVSLRQLTFE